MEKIIYHESSDNDQFKKIKIKVYSKLPSVKQKHLQSSIISLNHETIEKSKESK
jgi:hypothetical protein